MKRQVLGILGVALLTAGCAQLGIRYPEAAPAADAVMISETREGGQGLSAYQELTGTWLNSTGKSTAEGCSAELGSRFADIAGGPGGATAQWTLVPAESGNYDVQVTWPPSGNAIGVTYTVACGGEISSQVLTQDGWGGGGQGSNANQWTTVATVEADAGEPIVVTVSDEAVTGCPEARNAARVYADAARLVKK